jgi:hypothetical protein
MDSKTQKVLNRKIYHSKYADNENCFVFMRNYYLHRRFFTLSHELLGPYYMEASYQAKRVEKHI